MKFLAALVFTAGLSLAGSDGTLFPWANLAGVVIFACMIPLAKIIQGGKI
jgi:ABC-type transport system involved in cytochrome c biogenesis permease subunit